MIELDYRVYYKYLQATLGPQDIDNLPPQLVTEFGGSSEELIKFLLRRGGVLVGGVSQSDFVGDLAEYANAVRYPWVLYKPHGRVVAYYDVFRGNWFKKAWRRVKGFCKKAWKALPRVLGIAKKVVGAVAPVIPPPYGTVVTGVTAATSAVSNALNLIGNVSQKATGLALMDTASDKFVVVPQYRVSSNQDDYIMPNVPGNEYVPNTMYNGEWISGEPIEVPVEGTSAIVRSTAFRLEDHPNYENIKKYVMSATEAGDANPLWFQQRLKVKFTKTNVPNQQAADGYKATLRIGSDTFIDNE